MGTEYTLRTQLQPASPKWAMNEAGSTFYARFDDKLALVGS
jgi:hypothetical protein